MDRKSGNRAFLTKDRSYKAIEKASDRRGNRLIIRELKCREMHLVKSPIASAMSAARMSSHSWTPSPMLVKISVWSGCWNTKRPRKSTYIAAWGAGTPVGQGVILWDGYNIPELRENFPFTPVIRSVEVIENYRGHGIGSAIVNELETRARIADTRTPAWEYCRKHVRRRPVEIPRIQRLGKRSRRHDYHIRKGKWQEPRPHGTIPTHAKTPLGLSC